MNAIQRKIYEIVAQKDIAQASKKLQKMKTTGHMTHDAWESRKI